MFAVKGTCASWFQTGSFNMSAFSLVIPTSFEKEISLCCVWTCSSSWVTGLQKFKVLPPLSRHVSALRPHTILESSRNRIVLRPHYHVQGEHVTAPCPFNVWQVSQHSLNGKASARWHLSTWADRQYHYLEHTCILANLNLMKKELLILNHHGLRGAAEGRNKISLHAPWSYEATKPSCFNCTRRRQGKVQNQPKTFSCWQTPSISPDGSFKLKWKFSRLITEDLSPPQPPPPSMRKVLSEDHLARVFKKKKKFYTSEIVQNRCGIFRGAGYGGRN